MPERLAWRATTAGEELRLFWLRAFVHVCFSRLEGATQPEQLESTCETMSGVITSSSISVTRMGGVDGCCGVASGEREGDRERAEAPSGAPLRVSIECLDENDRAQFLASETEKNPKCSNRKNQISSKLGCANLVLHATLAGALPAPACRQTLIFGRPNATHV